jgi:hypothetical protein
MRTNINNSNLKKLALTAAAAMVIATGSFAQSASYDLTALMSLETIMVATEHAIRYVAPEVNEAEEFSAAAGRLEMLANSTLAALKYAAPGAEEDVAPVISRLDVLAAATETSLKYEAPAHEVNEVAPAMFAHITK